ncbi:hypothetical protein P8C59_007547 [Phyllachora maydis]|uniref:laccase n=1 Tax=Phyllachora maydis TaxID=1825666 RepID=A0AAD9I9R4_9PEZI|nr:hypothetical protein P8C59_007547 [Phyllachora maydis]
MDRACWCAEFNISTDYETSTPTTGVTRSYTLSISEVDNWVGGDGVVKEKAMLVNGQFPGPPITADWGDRINVTVINNLVTNGTSIHFHGIRQLHSNMHDGTSGVTECPLPPGSTKTYSFLATQYGTSWYHSHFSAQYGNGVLGSIVIHGPASANYDIDLGPFPISDWYYSGVDALLTRVNDPNNPFVPGFPGAPPNADNLLFNGSNVNPQGPGGTYAQVTLTPGKLHLLRLINPSVENTYTVSLVGHSFTVIATDLVPVQPTTVTSLFMAVGQRYDVIINASQPVASYWFNATSSSGPCGVVNNPSPAAIFSYSGSTAAIPTNPDWDGRRRGEATGSVASMAPAENVISLPSANTMTFWLIQNNSSIPHPIHLHGHDILVLGASPALASPLAPGNTLRTYDPAKDGPSLKGDNPTRRDTTVLPAWGWLVVAYVTNNPGAWLFHCHNVWHVSQGLSVQFLEQENVILQDVDQTSLDEHTPNICHMAAATFPHVVFLSSSGIQLKALVLLISPVLASRGFSFKDKTICNGFPYGSSTEIEGFKADLSRLEHTAPPQTYPGGQCTRIACRGNSGVYVCSDLHPPQTQTVPWQQISRAFTDSISKCKIFSNCGYKPLYTFT